MAAAAEAPRNEEGAGQADADGKKGEEKRVKVKKWTAVAFWSYGECGARCALALGPRLSASEPARACGTRAVAVDGLQLARSRAAFSLSSPILSFSAHAHLQISRTTRAPFATTSSWCLVSRSAQARRKGCSRERLTAAVRRYYVRGGAVARRGVHSRLWRLQYVLRAALSFVRVLSPADHLVPRCGAGHSFHFHCITR
jgi:hypothetical protein